jgi:hypothetical protein
MLPECILTFGAFGIFEDLSNGGLPHVQVRVAFQVAWIHFLVSICSHVLASLRLLRIKPARMVAICVRISIEQSGVMDGALERGAGSVSGLCMHGDQARIQAVIPFLRNRANPGAFAYPERKDTASFRSCS